MKARTSLRWTSHDFTFAFSTGSRPGEPRPLPWTTRMQRRPARAESRTKSATRSRAASLRRPCRSISSWSTQTPRRSLRTTSMPMPRRRNDERVVGLEQRFDVERIGDRFGERRRLVALALARERRRPRPRQCRRRALLQRHDGADGGREQALLAPLGDDALALDGGQRLGPTSCLSFFIVDPLHRHPSLPRFPCGLSFSPLASERSASIAVISCECSPPMLRIRFADATEPASCPSIA